MDLLISIHHGIIVEEVFIGRGRGLNTNVMRGLAIMVGIRALFFMETIMEDLFQAGVRVVPQTGFFVVNIKR